MKKKLSILILLTIIVVVIVTVILNLFKAKDKSKYQLECNDNFMLSISYYVNINKKNQLKVNIIKDCNTSNCINKDTTYSVKLTDLEYKKIEKLIQVGTKKDVCNILYSLSKDSEKIEINNSFITYREFANKWLDDYIEGNK